jgi:hypothetical protein
MSNGAGGKVIRTIIPVAPQQYDQTFANQLARNLDFVIDEVRSPISNIPNIATSGEGGILQVGDLYEKDGFVKIVRENDVLAGTTAGITAVGTVIVSTP